MPKIDGVTRTLGRLLEHLHSEGHEALVLGPDTGLKEYLGHPVVGTFGIPILVYPGLKLNFARLRFIRRLQQFRPDVVHFVDPIWLGAQMIFLCKRYLPNVPRVSSYHTNLPTYSSLFGMGFLEAPMWWLTRLLHEQCEVVFCPSESTRRMLQARGIQRIAIWGRGVDTEMFHPQARDENLRAGWGCKPKSQELLNTLHDQAMSSLEQSKGLSAEEAFIRTPDTFPVSEFSPPPAYESVCDVPPLPGAHFALPPPVVPGPSMAETPKLSGVDNDSKAVVLFVGRISWEKNIRLLVEAFRLLPASVKENAKLVIVGDGPARAELTRLCQKYGLDAAFMGHQKGQRLASMYASSSIFAFPSFTETFGQVVLEALASGLPVVGLHAEGTSDLICHGITGLLMDTIRATSTNQTKSKGVSGMSSATAAAAAAAAAAASAATATAAAAAAAVSSSTSSASSASSQPPVTGSSRHASLTNRLRESTASNDCLPLSASSGRAVPMAASSTLKPGLPSPIPSVKEFASLMSVGTQTFHQCAQAYSILLERLIRDRTLRATMGQRAQQYASNKTWWDAMEAPVRGYEEAIARAGQTNLTDAELEALRNAQRKIAPLSGPIVTTIVILYLAFFVLLWTYLL